MVKRIKRAIKGIESIEKEIKEHIRKIKQDIKEGNVDRGKYHCKEINKSLITSLEIKLKIAKIDDKKLLEKYKNEVDKLKKLL